MKILYFAWVRERTGRAGEEVEPPPGTDTVGDLIAWLKSRGPEFEAAFADEGVIRAAIDQTHVSHDTSLDGAREIAFFPPMTGG
jgi:molybdopterin synthase sulfur carrier subunit